MKKYTNQHEEIDGKQIQKFNSRIKWVEYEPEYIISGFVGKMILFTIECYDPNDYVNPREWILINRIPKNEEIEIYERAHKTIEECKNVADKMLTQFLSDIGAAIL